MISLLRKPLAYSYRYSIFLFQYQKPLAYTFDYNPPKTKTTRVCLTNTSFSKIFIPKPPLQTVAYNTFIFFLQQKTRLVQTAVLVFSLWKPLGQPHGGKGVPDIRQPKSRRSCRAQGRPLDNPRGHRTNQKLEQVRACLHSCRNVYDSAKILHMEGIYRRCNRFWKK